jgi:hypothetical protein
MDRSGNNPLPAVKEKGAASKGGGPFSLGNGSTLSYGLKDALAYAFEASFLHGKLSAKTSCFALF